MKKGCDEQNCSLIHKIYSKYDCYEDQEYTAFFKIVLYIPATRLLKRKNETINFI